MRKLAIIGAGPMASIYAERCRQLGIETHCLAWAQGAVARDDVDHFHDVSVTDLDALVSTCREVGAGGVLPTTELTIFPAAHVAAALGLNGISPEVARVITDKYRNREATAGVEGLHHPRYWLVRSPEDVAGLGVTYPVIVKPTSEGGKRGVSVVYDEDGLSEAVAYAASEKKSTSDIVVEEYVPGGAEYSVESLSYHGEHRIVQVTEKWSSGAPHCVELGHHQPARLDSRMRARVEDVISRALTAVGVDNGCCHTEIKICDGDIYLIEFNTRPGGDHIAYPLTELSTGYPYITGIIETAFDVDVLPDPASLGVAWAGICFVTEQTSALKPVFDTCQNQPWCYEKHQVTEELRPLTHNRGYDTNYFIYRAEDARPEFLEVWGAGVTG